MDSRLALTTANRLQAAQDWWREAGVDLAFHDRPQRWLASDEPAAVAPREGHDLGSAPAPATPPPGIGGDRAAWPADLASFSSWWLDEPSLDAGGPFPRVAPRGEAGAAVMMLVPMPEQADSATLLSGVHGRLLASFAEAAGLDPASVYLAAGLPRHTPVPDWAQLRAAGLGEVLLHHLALVAPQRLIVFGSGILPLLGHDPAQAAPAVSELSIQGAQLPLLAAYAPERLLANARQRAALWRRWLDWTRGDMG